MLDYVNYKVDDSLYDEHKDLRLEKTYELCVNELGLQQTKRDQIIAFYIAIISFVVPQILEMDNAVYKAAGFLVLFVIGALLTKAIIRYRVYKEAYWMTCRTISTLFTFKQEKISKELVQHIFYNTMKKNMPNVVVVKNKRKKEKPSTIRTFLYNRKSTETILFEVMAILISLVLWISIYIVLSSLIACSITISIAAATFAALADFIYWCCMYGKKLVDVYSVIFNGNDDSFNDTYSKAWFLHSFYREVSSSAKES